MQRRKRGIEFVGALLFCLFAFAGWVGQVFKGRKKRTGCMNAQNIKSVAKPYGHWPTSPSANHSHIQLAQSSLLKIIGIGLRG